MAKNDGKWDCEIHGVTHHVDYDPDSGEIFTISDDHGNDPRGNIDRAVEEKFRNWWLETAGDRAGDAFSDQCSVNIAEACDGGSLHYRKADEEHHALVLAGRVKA